MTDEEAVTKLLEDNLDLLSAARLEVAKNDAEGIQDMSFRELVRALMDGGFPGCDEMTPGDLAPILAESVKAEHPDLVEWDLAVREYLIEELKELS